MEQRSPLLPALGFIAPVQLFVGVIIFIPALYVFWLSLTESSFGQAPVFVGLANYGRVLADPYFWKALVNTVIVVLIVVHVELLLGLGMALLFASGVPFRPLLLAAVLAPYAVSEVSAVVMWRFLFDPEVGFATQALTALGLPPLEWAVVPWQGLLLVSLLSIWLHLPFTFVILYAARLAIPGELYEAAQMDGASGFARFRRVTLPLLVPAMLIAMLFRYIFAFRLFSEVWLLTGGGPARQTEVLAVYLYLEAFRYNAFGDAAATGWLLVVASLVLALWYLRRLYKEMFATYAP
ncbi:MULTISPECIES: sugar ABC transporter permease [unclassified Chelatococcus]|uniref:carbohydrate ABC transporter permease n=1 Tax=unclassified Chelatococcus TaxID=2638111 RepID=UPI001BCBD9FA|nr:MULTISPECIES: sugar ABC transporter permease [unclassified Chelatococcus]CAH1673750.1 Multiple sugar transport system permease protein [Hyphomicrobiales bacterium]MBS7738754.1 sugar ABC transporter permease [Chelatococcus sp. HY11]MBX3543158.1 sugar ABC transporter permease [Chelatococcus sp.]MCO5076716.1 sugar ABC transporter permease [Chelatococcus sp.]CAH1674008.1 Multiple sugar transport system permease protein [Hyphomicrobiales bacterium]